MALGTILLLSAISAVIGAIGGVITTGMNMSQEDKSREDTQEFTANENQIARDFTSEEAQKSRDFEEYMASTAMQRQVSDYKAAGINVGAIGGSGATSGASATGLTAPMTSATSGRNNVAYGFGNLNSGLDSYISSMARSAARQTLKQNSVEFGDNLTKSLKAHSAKDSLRDYEPGGKYYDPTDPEYENF